MIHLVPDPDQVRRTAEEVLNRDEFREHRSIVERILDWLGDHLHLPSPSLGNGPGLIGDLFAVVVAALVVFVIVRAVLQARHGAGRRPRRDQAATVTIDAPRSADAWAAEAARLEAAGNHREALRARYRELLARLDDRHVLDDVAGRTTGEQRAELVARRPDIAEPFATATDLFEAAWYGGAPVDAATTDRLRAAAVAVLDSPAPRPPAPSAAPAGNG
jgi:hypothetical protein